MVIVSQPVLISDPDTMILRSDPGVTTILALQLEACMMCDEKAQQAYAKIYGRPWIPLCDVE